MLLGYQLGYGLGGNLGLSIGGSILPPLPASAVFGLHSEIRCTSSSWTDFIGGRVLPGVNSPTVGTDGSNFRGRRVAQPTTTGSKYWLGSGLGTIVAAGARPWMYVIGRARSVPDALTRYFIQTNGVNGLSFRANGFRCLWDSAGSLTTAAAADTTPHEFSTWVTASLTNLQVDSNLTTTGGYTAAMVANMTSVGIGSDSIGGFIPDTAIAFVLICSSLPSVAERAALNAYSDSYWGV